MSANKHYYYYYRVVSYSDYIHCVEHCIVHVDPHVSSSIMMADFYVVDCRWLTFMYH